MPKIRNIIIFVVIGTALVLVYIFFVKPSGESETPSLVSSSPSAVTNTAIVDNSAVTQEFLTLLLSVRSIKLNDTIFSDKAFGTLLETPIDLAPDGTEGRPNPFAPLGSDVVAPGEIADTESTLTP